MKFGYNLYGLKVNSEIKLPRYKIKKVYLNPHTVIKLGKIKKPDLGIENTVYRPFTVFNRNFYYQEIPTIARYLVKENNEVIVQSNKRKLSPALSLFFIDTILPIILIKNGLFPIHASAIANDDGVYLFSANRGKGKSCIAARLAVNGYSFVSDDLCVIKWDKKNDRFVAKCHHPYSYLWRNSMGIFGKNLHQYKRHFIRKALLKVAVNMNRHSLNTYREVKGINYIEAVNEKIDVSRKVVKGMHKLNLSKNIIHSHKIANVVMKQKELFYYNGLIAKHLEFAFISRATDCPNPDLTNFIIDEILTETT